MLDFKIENVKIYNGYGEPPFISSLGIKDDIIFQIEKKIGIAKKKIDGSNLCLMPGIIDNHTHYDAQITWDPYVEPSLSLGVTTIIIGNCGFTIAPCKEHHRDFTIKNLTHVEGMSLKSLREGINWDFESFSDYLNMLQNRGVGPNVAAYIGHSSVRTYVLGEEAIKRSATKVELEEMGKIISDAMKNGACGFSTTLSTQHNGHNGIPMPSRLASKEELIFLSEKLKTFDHGVLMMTKSNETSIEFIETLAKKANKPYVIAALLHSNITPNAVFDDLKKIETARKRKNFLYGAISVCPLTFEFTIKDPYPLEGLKSWEGLFGLKKSELILKLRDHNFREKIKNELSKKIPRIFNGEWEKIFITHTEKKINSFYNGQSLREVSESNGGHPLDIMFDLAIDENLETIFTATLLNSDEKAVGKMINNQNSIISLSDAGAHLTFFCDAGYGLHLIGHWARDLKILSIQQAVKKITYDQARLFGIRDRGIIEVGKKADLVLFDEEKINRGKLYKVNDFPANGERLTTLPIGLKGVWVNGVLCINNGDINKSILPGKLLRRFSASEM